MNGRNILIRSFVGSLLLKDVGSLLAPVVYDVAFRTMKANIGA